MNGRTSAAVEVSQVVPCPEAPAVSLETQRLVLTLVLVIMDCLALGVAFRVGYWLRFDLGVTVAPEVVPEPLYYPHLVALLIPTFLLVFAIFGLYQTNTLLGGVTEYSRVFNSCTTATMAVVIVTFIRPQSVISRLWLASAWVLSFLTVALGRFVVRRLAYAMRERGYVLAPAVIVGTNQEAVTLAAELRNWRTSGLRILGFVAGGGQPEGGRLEGVPVLGSVCEIGRVIAEHGVEELIVAITALSREELLQLCEEVNGVKGVCLRLSSGLYELLTTGVTVTSRGGVPLISVNRVRLGTQQVCVKTLLDYSIAALALLLLSPLLIVLAILVKSDSSGPVIHRRRVLGVSGAPFDAFKFRTMYADGDDRLRSSPELGAALRANHKLREDPRVTRVGRWLRKFSLDELPQLFNVLLGQMSLVGPRMITAEETEKYGRHKLNLLTVKPGITGFWQVNGRSDVTYEDRVNLDMYYIRNYSVWLDLQILFVQTLPAVIRGRGAY
jgi:exopolysaccharide biosynthesis polyprenyl glycosylphosphotransferase